MKLPYLTLLALSLAFTACSAPKAQMPTVPTAPSPKPSPAASGAPAAPVDVEAILKAYKSAAFVRINESPVDTGGPHPGPKFLYVDQANAARYTADFKGEVPVGATYVKTSEDESLIAVMKKREPGTDPGADDWYYYEKVGASVIFDGNTTTGGGLCHSCHKFAHSYDNLLGLDDFTKP